MPQVELVLAQDISLPLHVDAQHETANEDSSNTTMNVTRELRVIAIPAANTQDNTSTHLVDVKIRQD
ncbi:hypothetical protein GGX14DRAFT_554276 [Mycena pura]|uniref:Uncharacterized protein n=1 Tax=Mycena pura TaxID=153505 RepID=A0AAD6YSF5_9AGAR|nr:hypothetical protein GGX14DRAFT_554276 [Mycena pura]